MPIEKTCERCGATRWLTPAAVKRGEGRFCSRACTDHAGMARVPLEKRFWKKVQMEGPLECWLWLGTRNQLGYGITAVTLNGRTQRLRAHRVSYEFAYGPIPDGLHVRHRCDTPPCVNPRHLIVGTRAQNMQDMV